MGCNIAINPADAKMLDYSAAAVAILGYDFAGTIVALELMLPHILQWAIGWQASYML